MGILWDDEKNDLLKKTRRISFEEIADLILQKRYVDILKHPSRRNQRLFLIPIGGYMHVVPFVIDKENNIVLKTVYRSRKFQKLAERKKQ